MTTSLKSTSGGDGILEVDDLISGGISFNALMAETASEGTNIKYPPSPLVAAVVDGVTNDSAAIQAIINYVESLGGGNVIFPRGTTIVNSEIELKSNVNLLGCGYASKIKTTVGSTGNGLNMLKAFEKSNIVIRDLYVENLGYGKSGTWEPAGTFDGVGACILIVGCDNVTVQNCNVIRGGGTISGEGIGNIYFSCCTNSKIVNNFVSLCDNAITVDSWYNQSTGKELFINDGIVIQGNTITQGGGRGIVIENRSNTLEKGSISVIGNTINKMAYAGIQGNNIFNCTIIGNAIDGDKTGRTYGGTDNMWFGMEFVSGSKQAVIIGNTIKKVKFNGIRCFESQDLVVSANNILTAEDYAIFIKNTNENMFNVKLDGNNINTVNDGIFMGRDASSSVSLTNNTCLNNTVKFNTIGGSIGIDFQNQTLGNCDGNISSPVVTFGGSIGIRANTPIKCTINSNMVNSLTNGINISNDVDSVSDSNLIELCSSAYKLDNCQRTTINSKIRGGTNAFEILNGKTTESTKCRAFNTDIDGTTNVKTATGLIFWGTGNTDPASGTWDVGDRIRNVTPVLGSFSEWIYVSGSWRTVGAALA